MFEPSTSKGVMFLAWLRFSVTHHGGCFSSPVGPWLLHLSSRQHPRPDLPHICIHGCLTLHRQGLLAYWPWHLPCIMFAISPFIWISCLQGFCLYDSIYVYGSDCTVLASAYFTNFEVPELINTSSITKKWIFLHVRAEVFPNQINNQTSKTY